MKRYLATMALATLSTIGTASAQDPCEPSCDAAVYDFLPAADAGGTALASLGAAAPSLVLATVGALATGLALASFRREIAHA